MNEITVKGTKQERDGLPWVSFPKEKYHEFLSNLKNGEELVITIAVKRSPSQNRMFHAMVKVISDAIGEPDLEACKAWLVCKFFGCREVEIGGERITVPVRTSELSKEEFSVGYQRMEAWALTELGIYEKRIQKD